ncbi:hypothetical protein TNCV_544741 [Trichonephila clavipes]|nr:hypothetical protein TNCV_544741 [Trichonephila clavipes]
MHGHWPNTSCRVFNAEAVAIYRVLQLIDSNMPLKYCLYTDSMIVWFQNNILLVTKSRRYHGQRARGQRGSVGNNPSAARSSAIRHEVLRSAVAAVSEWLRYRFVAGLVRT